MKQVDSDRLKRMIKWEFLIKHVDLSRLKRQIRCEFLIKERFRSIKETDQMRVPNLTKIQID